MQPVPDHPHVHAYDLHDPVAERRTRQVMWLTAAMMVVEIVAGTVFGSMALLADGWHMSSHALALGVSAGAYALARRHARDPRFSFGTWKIEVLGGYTSAVFLLGVAGYMGFESMRRLFVPAPIHYGEAIPIAVLGLFVNLVSAWLLSAGAHGHHHDHGHGHDHDHHHGHAHHDLNLRAAYLHVIADAATSVLAILALAGGWWLGWGWLDPVMGVVGAVLVALWAKGLIAETGKVLLDREMDHPVVGEIREVVAEHAAAHGLRLTDLHVWRVGRGAWACALTLVTSDPALTADAVRQWLAVHEEIVHVTVELQGA